ncbi:unnamed protein product [Closterium sp. Naga37s-1]|nr:unnamed protein product [Closterium sp. Naga37s-1]
MVGAGKYWVDGDEVRVHFLRMPYVWRGLLEGAKSGGGGERAAMKRVLRVAIVDLDVHQVMLPRIPLLLAPFHSPLLLALFHSPLLLCSLPFIHPSCSLPFTHPSCSLPFTHLPCSLLFTHRFCSLSLSLAPPAHSPFRSPFPAPFPFHSAFLLALLYTRPSCSPFHSPLLLAPFSLTHHARFPSLVIITPPQPSCLLNPPFLLHPFSVPTPPLPLQFHILLALLDTTLSPLSLHTPHPASGLQGVLPCLACVSE